MNLYYCPQGQVTPFPRIRKNLKLSIWECLVGTQISPKRIWTSKGSDMKRAGHLWEKMLEEDNAFVALYDGTQKKRGDRIVQEFLFSPEEVAKDSSLWHQIDPKRTKEYCRKLIAELREGRWHHKKPYDKHIYSKNHTKGKGKHRTGHVPCFRDHIVHHMAINVCKEAFTKGMHPHCCGSVIGRGPKHVVSTGSKWFQDDKECRYFVKLDIKKFFDSIRPDLLMDAIRKRIKDKYLLEIFEQIVHAAPTACPVGFYVSPILANLFLQDFDWFVEQQLYKERRGKRIKYVRHYMRYMDDMLLIGTSKADLYKAVHRIKEYLASLGLEIKQTWEIKRIGIHEKVNGKWKLKKGTYWCDFIGYKFCRDATILRSGIFIAAQRLAKRMFRADYYTPHQCSSINARIGWAKHCDSVHFLDRSIRPYVNIKATRRIISYVDKIRKQRVCASC